MMIMSTCLVWRSRSYGVPTLYGVARCGRYTLHMHNFQGQCSVHKLCKLLDGVALAVQQKQQQQQVMD